MEWHEAFKYLWGLLVPAGWWIFNKQDKRIENMEAALTTKADKIETKREADHLRDVQAKLFDMYREHEDADRNRHEEVLTALADMSDKVHTMHVSILEKLAK